MILADGRMCQSMQEAGGLSYTRMFAAILPFLYLLITGIRSIVGWLCIHCANEAWMFSE